MIFDVVRLVEELVLPFFLPGWAAEEKEEQHTRIWSSAPSTAWMWW